MNLPVSKQPHERLLPLTSALLTISFSHPQSHLHSQTALLCLSLPTHRNATSFPNLCPVRFFTRRMSTSIPHLQSPHPGTEREAPAGAVAEASLMSYELGSYPDSLLPVPRSREAGSLACLRFWRFVAASLIADSSSVRRPGVPEVEGALLSRRVSPFPVSRDRHDLVDLEGHRMPGGQ